MARPIKCRRVAFLPGTTYFKPSGIPLRVLDEVILTLEETESLRLKDIEDLDQEQGAMKMNVSRPTFQRILSSARKKVADALLNGKAIRIGGGNFESVPLHLRCTNGHEWNIEFTDPADDMPLCPVCSAPPEESTLPRCWRSPNHSCCREQIKNHLWK